MRAVFQPVSAIFRRVWSRRPTQPIRSRMFSSSSGSGVTTSDANHPYLTQNAKYMPGFSFPAPRRLDQIVKYALIEREPPETIKEIWTKFHEERNDSVATVFEEDEFKLIQERARKNPYFIFPVFKEEDKFFLLVSQFQDRYCIFTYLEDYRQNPSAAEPYFAITCYDELISRKQIVLVRGDYSAHLTKPEANTMLKLFRFAYLEEPKWVETFNQNPREFNYQQWLERCPREHC